MISDAPARAKALDITQSFIVQAPAGSGKTALLVYRMLKLLAQVEKPEQVLAITFTRKATSEMRHRVLDLLTKADNNTMGDLDTEDEFERHGVALARKVMLQSDAKDWSLLDTPQQLQIKTIDAFCAKLSGDMPWLSRLGDKPRVTEQAEPHYQVAIEQLLSQLLVTPSQIADPLKAVLLELDFDYNKVRRLFAAMLGKRDQWLRHLMQNDITQLRPTLETAWREICSEHLESLENLLPRETLLSLISIGRKAAQFHVDNNSPLMVFAQHVVEQKLSVETWRGIQFLLTTQGAKGFRKVLSVKCGFPPTEKALKNKMLAILEDTKDDLVLLNALQQLSILPATEYNDGDWQQIISLEKVLKALAAHLQLRFRAAGECDHSEVAQRANLALQELGSPTDLALRIDYQLQHILVDEFQDTSHSQLELLKRLTAGWQQAAAGQGQTLFLVGDPMQSIYRFREADVSLFLQVSDNAHTRVFDNIDITALLLSENFRSTTGLVDWFNATFASSFSAQNQVLTGAISYAPASSSIGAQTEIQEVLIESKQREANVVVQTLQSAIADLPDDASQVALLVRSRTHLDHLLPAIRDAGIAYVGVEIQPLNETPAVLDVVALCKAICRLDDRIAWFGLLRGPWCGLELAEIKQIAARQDLPIWEQLQRTLEETSLSDNSLARLSRFCTVMRQALMQRQQVGLHSVTRWAWLALGGQHTLMGAELEDIDAVISLIEGLQTGGDIASLNELDTSLDKLYAQPARAEQARVVVSTMHKAKGLQYHTVILPSLHSPSRSDDKDLLMWAEHTNAIGQSRLLLAPIRLEKQATSHFEYLRSLDKQRNSNERIRLMYVACTRAERKLILLAQAKLDPKTGDVKPPTSSSLLATIWQAAGVNFTRHFDDESSSSISSQVDTIIGEFDQTLLRLPNDGKITFADSVNWQSKHQMQTQDASDDSDVSRQGIEYDWATEVAAAVGIVMHNWLQFNGDQLLTTRVDDVLLRQWRNELVVLRVPPSRQQWALDRLSLAISNMQDDPQAQFIFQQHELQQNEYALSVQEHGIVKTYRIDRTFVDSNSTRWIIDYKTTSTRAQDVDAFVDQQLAQRHRQQLEKYGALMSQIDKRPIKLAVYFPMLSRMRSWDYQKPSTEPL